MDLEVILFDKDGFKFSRFNKNNYKITFTIENNNIVLSKIIDFSLIKLIYDLNDDVYEKANIEQLNNSEAIITLLMKHFFEDLGLPQRFSYIYMKKIVEERKITFVSESIKSQRPPNMPQDAELMVIENMISIFDIVSPHKVNFSCNIIFEESIKIPSFAEKMTGIISNKIFKRVKQFIENVRL